MVANVIMPALGMAQETGRILEWLKQEGEQVTKGEPLMEIETDKAAVTIEAPDSGELVKVSAFAGDDVPVGQVIAFILAPGETAPELPPPPAPKSSPPKPPTPSPLPQSRLVAAPQPRPTVTGGQTVVVNASQVAMRMAADRGIDLALVQPAGGRVEKDDILRYLRGQSSNGAGRLIPASPKARRLAAERGVNIATIAGSGPEGAVLAADVLAFGTPVQAAAPVPSGPPPDPNLEETEISSLWRLMAQHVSHSWVTAPHFFLQRDVDASQLIDWRKEVKDSGEVKITFTDLLIKQIALTLEKHPNINAVWQNNTIARNPHVNIGMAVGVDDGLVVPVIHDADQLSIQEIAEQRAELIERAMQRKLRPEDLEGGSFTISNLGMYNIDRFSAIINLPQAAILAVGRIAERVVAEDGQPVVRPILSMNLSCDHRVIDGLRGAQFLDTLADLIEQVDTKTYGNPRTIA